jgi:hypothetical protein
MKPRVLITLPNRGWLHKTVVQSLMHICSDDKYERKVAMPALTPPIENTMCHMAKVFWEEGFDWWLNIDDDNPPRRNPLALIEHDKDIVSLPTPIYMEEMSPALRWNVFKEVETGFEPLPPGQGFQQVDGAGTGCILIAKRVFQNMDMRHKPFARAYDEFGRVKAGHDLEFCRKARKQGFEIWTHWDYPCEHRKEVQLGELIGKA